MTTRVERAIEVRVPVSVAYNQWTQFEDFPHFMSGVKEVRQLDDQRLHWVAEIAGVRREWDATILEQVPDYKVAWAATSGATNAGAVRFEPVQPDSTMVHLTLEYEPEDTVAKIGDKLGFVERQVTSDLQRFKELVEDQGYATGAWRGAVNPGLGVRNPGVTAATSEGESGKAGVSGKVVAAGAAAVAAGAAAAVGAAGKKSEEEQEVRVVERKVVRPEQPATPVEQPVEQPVTQVKQPPPYGEPVATEVSADENPPPLTDPAYRAQDDTEGEASARRERAD